MPTSLRLSVFVRGALLALLLVAAGSSRAHAQSDTRVFGFGTAVGGGVQASALVGVSGTETTASVNPDVLLPSLEFRYFLRPYNLSIDLSIPVTNMIVVSAAAKLFYFEADAYATFHVGKRAPRFVGGAGVGFDLLVDSSDGKTSALGGIRIPGQIGFEATSDAGGFGFSVLARPFFELLPGSSSVVGGGAILALDFMGYVTRGSD